MLQVRLTVGKLGTNCKQTEVEISKGTAAVISWARVAQIARVAQAQRGSAVNTVQLQPKTLVRREHRGAAMTWA